MSTPSPRAIRQEQDRQARSIHGGLMGYLVARLGIALSRLWLPTKMLRLGLYRTVFGKKYPPGMNEEEAELPLHNYPSLNAVFTRGIKPQYRPIPQGTPEFLAPCDGTVQDVGVIKQGQLLTLKNIIYSIESLLPGIETSQFEGGRYVVIFLSPIDCHRVFSPQDGHFEEVIHVPGWRLLVHPPFQKPEFPVYALNERMIFRFTTPLGPCIIVMVAGWGVGNITLPMAPRFRPRGHVFQKKIFSPPHPVHRGEWCATFQLGSTVVLITPPEANSQCVVSQGEKVKYGQPTLRYSS